MERFDIVQKISLSTWRTAKTRLLEHPCVHFFLHNTYCRFCGDLQNNPSLQTMREEAPPVCRSWLHKWKWLYKRGATEIKVCQKCGLAVMIWEYYVSTGYDPGHMAKHEIVLHTKEELEAELGKLCEKDLEWEVQRKKKQSEREDGRREIMENWKGELRY